MSGNDVQKADQIAYRCYSKLALLVHEARLGPAPARTGAKPDRWFNLECADIDADAYKDQLRIYRFISTATHDPPSFELDVLLAVPDLSPNQVLVYRRPEPSSSSRVLVEPTPSYVLLETWSLVFDRSDHLRLSDADADLAPSSIYKHGIGLFRAVYALLRVAPAWK
ncbi:phosphorylated protein that interacts with Vac8p, partial [Vararia minispora EC-137]